MLLHKKLIDEIYSYQLSESVPAANSSSFLRKWSVTSAQRLSSSPSVIEKIKRSPGKRKNRTNYTFSNNDLSLSTIFTSNV
jgi:hypothetical protein